MGLVGMGLVRMGWARMLMMGEDAGYDTDTCCISYILDDKVVMHVCTSGSRSSFENSKLVAIFSKLAMATLHAAS